MKNYSEAIKRSKNEYMVRKREKRWNVIFDRLGNVCNKCKTNKGPFETDHINKKDKEFGLLNGIGLGKPLEVWEKELEKCQLLCKPCHRQKDETDNGKAQHGSHAMYRYHKCRCIECKNFKTTYERNRRRKK